MKWGQYNQRVAGAGLFLLGTGLQWWAAQSALAVGFGVGFLLLAAGFYAFGQGAGKDFPPAAGWPPMLLAVLLLNILYSRFSFSGAPYLEGLFRVPVLGSTLAHLLLNSLLAGGLLSFAQHSFRRPALRQLSVRKKMALAFLSNFILSAGALAIIVLIRSLVLDSGLQFDFRNIFNLGALSFTGMACVVLWLFWLLLLSLWLCRGVMQLGLSQQQRLTAIVASLLISAPLAMALAQGINTLAGALILILLLYLFLLDLFVDLDAGSPAWLIGWLGLAAALGAGFFFIYKTDTASQQRLAFARSLASPRDNLAEKQLMALTQSDTLLLTLMEKAPAAERAELHLLEHYPYLGKNYLLKWDTAAPPEERQLASSLSRLAPNTTYYTYALGPYAPKGAKPGWLLFRPATRPAERIYQELIPNNPVRQDIFDFIITYEGETAARYGSIPEGKASPGQWPEPGRWIEQFNSRYTVLYYQGPGGYRVIVGEAPGGYLKPLSLFSYLFALLLMLAFLVFRGNRYFNLFPSTPPRLLVGEPSLRHRIQLSVIGLSLLAFSFIGLATIAYFRRTAIQSQQERLIETLNVLVRSISQEEEPPTDALSIKRLAYTHKVDITLYQQDGQLLASSAPFLFQKRWKEPQITARALQALRENAFRPVVLDEEVNGLAYKSAYVTLPDNTGEPAYFLQIPYTATDQGMQESVVEFMGALFNVYVFLLLIGGAVAITVARSITRPLAALGDKLRNFSLGANEPLEWNSPDEIGDLVEAYNQMIIKLEESTEKLRQSEREGAWREMAKQVAHEIKNPLTPMKLSIQYLQHAQRSDPERAATMIERVSKTLIEQIDGLTHIATAFSNFAEMPKAQNETLVLNEVVASIYSLFTEYQEPAEDIQLLLPEQPIQAFTDKKQLVRVLTNLVKNAQQAIPDGRQGRITIQLYRQAEGAIIKVSDNGAGIPEEVQPKVFQPNFTTKSSGMGLGLAMCKEIIETAGGRLYFNTEAEVGTDFFVELPEVR